jgi:hypothetical protein
MRVIKVSTMLFYVALGFVSFPVRILQWSSLITVIDKEHLHMEETKDDS